MILSDAEIIQYATQPPALVWRGVVAGKETALRAMWDCDLVAYNLPSFDEYVKHSGRSEFQSTVNLIQYTRKIAEWLLRTTPGMEDITEVRLPTTDEAESFKMITPFTSRVQRTSETGERIISHGCSSFGYDISMGRDYRIFRPAYGRRLDPKNPDESLMELVQDVDSIVVPPNGFVLSHSKEYLKIPANISVTILGKSTYARVGNITLATPLEAGWEGQVTLEFANTTPVEQVMYSDEGCVQAVFHRGFYCLESYADRGGKYQGQTGVTLSRM